MPPARRAADEELRVSLWAQRRQTPAGERAGVYRAIDALRDVRRIIALPLSTYSAPGGLRQGPGDAAQSLAEADFRSYRGVAECCRYSNVDHAVLIAGGGPTGLMLAGELALAGVDVAIVERRAGQDLIGARAGGLHARTIEVLDQRGIADRFLAQGQVAQVTGFSQIRLDISDFPTRHPVRSRAVAERDRTHTRRLGDRAWGAVLPRR